MKNFLCDVVWVRPLLLLCAVLSLWASTSALLHSSEFPEVYRRGTASNNATASAGQVQTVFRNVYEKVAPSVVFISTEKRLPRQGNPLLNDPFFRRFFPPSERSSGPRKSVGLGSGFIISSDGYICTNYHVIKEVDKIKVEILGTEYKAKVAGVDPLADIALLKIEPKKKLTPVRFSNSDTVQVGDWALSIGNPFGLDRSLTVGVVSAVRRNIDELGSAYIQTDASINQGNSGGPLMNYQGEVIGINRFIFSNNLGGGNLGIGFAIPINEAAKVLDSLKKDGRVKRGFIGIQMLPLSAQLVLDLEVPNRKGVYVNSVLKKSPAAKGGLQAGDVILSVDAKRVSRPREIVILINRTPIGKAVKLAVWREQKRTNVTIEVGERPEKL